MSEQERGVLARVRLKASELGYRLFRNNVGVFKTLDGRVVRTGLCVGSSDLIGYRPLKITPDMVGKTLAVFVALEVKKKGGKLRPEQKQFLDAIERDGGIAIKCDDPLELK